MELPAALDLLAATPTVDLTTTGARTGRPSRIEIWGWVIDGRYIITGTPGPRHWLANVRSDPVVTVHAAGHDLPGTAVVVVDPEFRRRVFTDDATAWYLTQVPLDRLVAEAPMIEITFS